MNKSVTFKSIKKNNPALSEKVVQSIKDMIKNGQLAEGDILPDELSMAEQFDVSRVTIREAMAKLESLGVIGKGRSNKRRVIGLTKCCIMDFVDEILNVNLDKVNDLYEIRKSIEVFATKLACERRDEEDIKRLASAIEQEKKYNVHGYSLEYRMVLHKEIFKASKNSLLIEIGNLLIEVLTLTKDKTYVRYKRPVKAMEEHEAIFNAIKSKDAQKGMEEMRKHLDNAYNVLFSRLEHESESPEHQA